MNRFEYRAYLARGCAIKGCLRPAKAIDHDHAICPATSHSCPKCRRGPVCVKHNYLIATIEAIGDGQMSEVLAFLGLEVNPLRSAA
jgi:hypothetical protein